MRTILFICEHGSAKSIVAAAFFNKRAEALGLSYRAIARGTDPDEMINPAAAKGLAADGLQPQSSPKALQAVECANADRVIAFLDLPETFQAPKKVEVWSVPLVSTQYEGARDAIVVNIERLLREIESA